ncbi:MAG: hypothetical protein GY771_04670 [bacterium]|nr:hypothetical protein [bacterium]
MRRYFTTAVTALVLYVALSCCDRDEDEPEGAKLIWHTETIEAGDNFGRFHSAAIDEWDYLHIVYSNDKYFHNCRLKYAHMTAAGWDFDVIYENATAKGFSLALDKRNRPHIVYSAEGGMVYSVYENGTWESEVIPGNGRFLRFCSLALDKQGNPHIVCSVLEDSELIYVIREGGSWNATVIEELKRCIAGRKKLCVDNIGNVHLAIEKVAGGPLKYARKTGDGWYIDEFEEASMSSWDNFALDVDSYGTPYIVWFDNTEKSVMCGTPAKDGWNIDIIGCTDPGSTDIAIAFDSNQSPHLAFYSGYGRSSSKTIYLADYIENEWVLEKVDTTAISTIDYEANISLVLDSEDNPHIVFYDDRGSELKHAWLAPAGRQIASVCP